MIGLRKKAFIYTYELDRPPFREDVLCREAKGHIQRKNAEVVW